MMIYRVQHPIISVHGIPEGSTSIVDIPVGSVMEVSLEPQRVGTVEVMWEGQRLRIFSVDLIDCAERINSDVPEGPGCPTT
jgi:hypothetical protein